MFNTYDKPIIIILNFKISGEGKLWLGEGGGGEIPAPPLPQYETLQASIGVARSYLSHMFLCVLGCVCVNAHLKPYMYTYSRLQLTKHPYQLVCGFVYKHACMLQVRVHAQYVLGAPNYVLNA